MVLEMAFFAAVNIYRVIKKKRFDFKKTAILLFPL